MLSYIDEEIFMPSMKGSQVLQGVADRGNGSPILAISSMAESVQHIQIQCFGKDGAGTAQRIDLAAGETLSQMLASVPLFMAASS
jgi:hypothetical protein